MQQDQQAYVQKEMAQIRQEIMELKSMLSRLRAASHQQSEPQFQNPITRLLFPRRRRPEPTIIVEEAPKPKPAINLEQMLPLLPQLGSMMPQLTSVMPQMKNINLKDTMQLLSNPAVTGMMQQLIGGMTKEADGKATQSKKK